MPALSRHKIAMAAIGLLCATLMAGSTALPGANPWSEEGLTIRGAHIEIIGERFSPDGHDILNPADASRSYGRFFVTRPAAEGQLSFDAQKDCPGSVLWGGDYGYLACVWPLIQTIRWVENAPVVYLTAESLAQMAAEKGDAGLCYEEGRLNDRGDQAECFHLAEEMLRDDPSP